MHIQASNYSQQDKKEFCILASKVRKIGRHSVRRFLTGTHREVKLLLEYYYTAVCAAAGAGAFLAFVPNHETRNVFSIVTPSPRTTR